MKTYNRKKKPKHTTKGKYVRNDLFDLFCVSYYTKSRSIFIGYKIKAYTWWKARVIQCK